MPTLETMNEPASSPLTYEHVVDAETLIQLRRIVLFERVFGWAPDSQLARTLALLDLEIGKRSGADALPLGEVR